MMQKTDTRWGRASKARVGGACVAFIGIIAISSPAAATDGYFSHGYGTQAEGLGGAAIAYPKDSLAIATNPASLLALGNRVDLGLEWFRPDRGASIKGNLAGPDQSFDGSALENFFIPEIGYTTQLSDDWAAGIAVYGNGGMNTHYRTNPFARFGSTGVAGVNLEQLFVSPALAYRLAPGEAIGVSANIGYQLFKAQGIGGFAGFSSNPGAVSDRNYDHAFGSGVRIGYQGQLTPELTIGAFWQSKTYFGKFKKYAGLFADHGDFDAPSTFGGGIAYKITPALDVAADVVEIQYSDVPSVGNSLAPLLSGVPLGATDGPGFGWRDATVFKLGFNYHIDPAWQIRAGWNYTTQPIRDSQTFLNILAPATVQHQFTAGATWTSRGGTELSGFVLYAPRHTVDGHGSIPAPFGGGKVSDRLSEFALGIAVGWHLGS